MKNGGMAVGRRRRWCARCVYLAVCLAVRENSKYEKQKRRKEGKSCFSLFLFFDFFEFGYQVGIMAVVGSSSVLTMQTLYC